MYTLDKDLLYQPALETYLGDYLHRTHSMGTNLQELDLQLSQLSGQIEKERVRKKTADEQKDSKSADENVEEQK